jgi:uncharacterized membrane protein (UPF0127 family)
VSTVLQIRLACAERYGMAANQVKVSLNHTPIMVELAATPLARAWGLTGRTHLDADAMLFTYSQSVYVPFTAQNCPMDLDLAFFDEDGSCIAVHRLTAFSHGPYWPPQSFRYALEYPAGRFDLRKGAVLAEMP